MREVIEERIRRLVHLSTIEMARIVFNAVAIADLADHGEIIVGAALQTLSLE